MSESSAQYPLQETIATRLVAAAVQRLQREQGLSQRDLALQLGYKTSVMLSHVALGRVPVPLDRVADLAKVLEIDLATLLVAVLEQRHPEIDFRSIMNIRAAPASPFLAKLEAIAGCPIDEFDSGRKTILEEVAAAANPRRRWLTIGEMEVFGIVREWLNEAGTNNGDLELASWLKAQLNTLSSAN